MIKYFDHLSAEQFKTLIDSIARITILIGGADGNLDKEESSWAKKITAFRAYDVADEMHDFYAKVGETFSDVLESELAELPNDVASRSDILAERLAKVNDIMPLLEEGIAKRLYNDYRSFAKHVAKASGGFFSFLSIGVEEDKWVRLKMINDPTK